MQTSETKQVTPAPGADRQARHAATTKHKAHSVQPISTPSPGYKPSEALGWTVASLFVLAVPVLFIAFWIAAIRYVWKRGTRKRAQEGRQHQ